MIIEYTTSVGEIKNTVKIETDYGVTKVVIDVSDLQQVKITQHFEEMEDKSLDFIPSCDEPLKVGDRVSIAFTSPYFNDGYANPLVLGTIYHVGEDDSLGIYVEWDDGTNNAYRRSDLVKE